MAPEGYGPPHPMMLNINTADNSVESMQSNNYQKLKQVPFTPVSNVTARNTRNHENVSFMDQYNRTLDESALRA